MKQYGSQGFLASGASQKALDHFLLQTAEEWALGALQGMINRAVKIIIRDYLEIYKSTHDTIPKTQADLVTGIIAMPEFNPYKERTPAMPQMTRKQAADQQAWPNGFQIQDYEDAALTAFYEDPHATLRWFMTNCIAERKKNMVKEILPVLMADQNIASIPSADDDIIELYSQQPYYQTRAQREAQ